MVLTLLYLVNDQLPKWLPLGLKRFVSIEEPLVEDEIEDLTVVDESHVHTHRKMQRNERSRVSEEPWAVSLDPTRSSEILFDNPSYAQIVGYRTRSPEDVDLLKGRSDDDLVNDLTHMLYQLNLLCYEARRCVLKYNPKLQYCDQLSAQIKALEVERLAIEHRIDKVTRQLEAIHLEKYKTEKYIIESLANEKARRDVVESDIAFANCQFEHSLTWHGVGMKSMFDFASKVANKDPENLLPEWHALCNHYGGYPIPIKEGADISQEYSGPPEFVWIAPRSQVPMLRPCLRNHLLLSIKLL